MHGTGSDLTRVLEYAKVILDDKNKPDYDHIWCVFDIEEFGKRTGQIKKVLREAEDANINVALSNPCFEVWILCHFEKFGQALDKCKNVIAEVKRHIRTYNKGTSIYDEYLSERTDTAIDNAKALMTQHGEVTDRIARNPSTEVYQLVELLLQISRNQHF